MTRTKLCDRQLPDYTFSEEVFNTVSHVAGAFFGAAALVLCVVRAALHSDAWAVVSSAIYGASLLTLYASSSLYHGLRRGTAKKVMQILDHCTIYFLIAGTYTPISLCAVRRVSPGWGWGLFGAVWGLAALGIVLTAIDLKKYSRFSMACYIGMGWCVLAAAKVVLEAVALEGLAALLAGGIAYTVGAVLYGVGKKRRYAHCAFHLAALIGSAMQFWCVFWWVI